MRTDAQLGVLTWDAVIKETNMIINTQENRDFHTRMAALVRAAVLEDLIADAEDDEVTEGVCGGCIIGGDVVRWLQAVSDKYPSWSLAVGTYLPTEGGDK